MGVSAGWRASRHLRRKSFSSAVQEKRGLDDSESTDHGIPHACLRQASLRHDHIDGGTRLVSYPLANLTVIVTVLASLFGVVLAKTYSDTVYEDMKLQRVTPWSGLAKLTLKQGWVMGSAVVPVFLFGLALAVITQASASRLTPHGSRTHHLARFLRVHLPSLEWW